MTGFCTPRPPAKPWAFLQSERAGQKYRLLQKRGDFFNKSLEGEKSTAAGFESTTNEMLLQGSGTGDGKSNIRVEFVNLRCCFDQVNVTFLGVQTANAADDAFARCEVRI